VSSHIERHPINAHIVSKRLQTVATLDFARSDALMTLRRELVTNFLLGEIFIALHTGGLAGEVLGLPGRSADVLDAVRVLEHCVDLLEGFARSLGEHEEDVDGHGDTEHAEDDIRTPGDVDEGRRDEVTEGEVESPVARGSQCDGLATKVVREQLRRIDPGDRSPGRSKARNEQV